jgi:hypothetical protein
MNPSPPYHGPEVLEDLHELAQEALRAKLAVPPQRPAAGYVEGPPAQRVKGYEGGDVIDGLPIDLIVAPPGPPLPGPRWAKHAPLDGVVNDPV